MYLVQDSAVGLGCHEGDGKSLGAEAAGTTHLQGADTPSAIVSYRQLPQADSQPIPLPTTFPTCSAM